jgi:16S rRNA (guanine(966)-N(2))-methyltransferase RsmD
VVFQFKIIKMQKKIAKKPVHAHERPQLAHQVRIIGGLWKRTPLTVLNATGLRPTPDRVRETVFNWINHLVDGDWNHMVCLDLFAGSGALGFEAASRGALAVTMVDAHTPVIRQLEEVKQKLQAEQVTLLRADALAAAQSMAGRGERFDLIFLDPPYQQDWLCRVLPLCAPLLKPGGLVYVESGAGLAFAAAQEAPPWLAPWEVVRADQAGIVFYHLLRRKP